MKTTLQAMQIMMAIWYFTAIRGGVPREAARSSARG